VEEQEEDKNEEQETEPKPEQNKADEKNDKAALTDDEQCHLRVPELGEWPETSDEGSMSDISSQPQQDDDHLSREQERHRVLTSDWAEAQDEEDWSESGHESMHPSCLRALDWSVSQPGAVKDDIWSMPFANNQTPNLEGGDRCSEKRSRSSRLDSDNWMTPFALAEGEVPGWFTDDKWFGKGQRGSQQLENDCWMTPFDELIGWTTPHVFTASDASTAPSIDSPIGSAVCIWKAGGKVGSEADGHISEGVGAEEIFTDGQQVFQPVRCATGQPLFTDGKQLYASVCVVVGPPAEEVYPTCDTAYDAGLSSSPCSTVSFMAECSDDDESWCAAIGSARDLTCRM